MNCEMCGQPLNGHREPNTDADAAPIPIKWTERTIETLVVLLERPSDMTAFEKYSLRVVINYAAAELAKQEPPETVEQLRYPD